MANEHGSERQEVGAATFTRREFVVGAAATVAAVGAGLTLPRWAHAAAIELPPLPYADNALDP